MSHSNSEDLKSLLSLATQNTESKEKIQKLLGEMLMKNKEKATPSRLKELFNSYVKKHNFSIGDIVQWKEGLKDRKRPVSGEPAIVVELLDPPVYDKEVGPGSSYFNIAYDIRLGVLDEEGDFLVYHYDSKRFEPYKDQ